MDVNEQRTQALSAVLQLGREVRAAQSLAALEYIIVNDTHRVVTFTQAVLWTFDLRGRVHIKSASGVSQVDPHAPYIQWSQAIAAVLSEADDAGKAHRVSRERFAKSLQEGWTAWCPGHLLWLPIHAPDQRTLGGLLLFRDSPWRAAEMALLEETADGMGHAWNVLQGRSRSLLRRGAGALVSRAGLLAFIAIAAALSVLEVQESSLAPAEVMARNSIIVSAPFEGVVETFHVRPNQAVLKGDPLFSLEDTAIRAKLDVAVQSLEVARAQLLQANQQAFSDVNKKASVGVLKAQMAEREAQVEYHQEQLARTTVRAERAGIAVFTDENDWLGKPLQVGERVLRLADPRETELRAWLDVGEAINLEPNARIRLFLNSDPTRPVEAKLYHAAYEAELRPDGALAYRVQAQFLEDEQPPRIGLKGTAKIYGPKVSLFYLVSRRPFAAIRQQLGL